MSEQPVDARLIEQTRQQIRQLVAEINGLSESDIPPQQFYPEFLERVVAAVAAVGGALWVRDGQGSPQLQCQINFDQSGLLGAPSLSDGHGQLLQHSFSDGEAKLLAPHSGDGEAAQRGRGGNVSDWSLIVAPLKVDRQTVGLVEVLLDPKRRQTAQRNAVRFVSELCEIGAGYLKNRQLRQMLDQQQLWSQLETFTRQIHTSLKPKEVAYIVANEGKRLVGCDRLSVAIVYGRKPVVEGVSGQEVVERRGNLVQLLTRLCNAVIRTNESLLYTGEIPEGLPPAVHDALDEYLAESGSKLLAVSLLRTTDKEGNPSPPFGALVAEQLEDVAAVGDPSGRLDVVGQHAAVALSNALTHHRVFLLPVWAAVGNSKQWMRGNRLAKLSVAVAVVLLLTVLLVFVPMELRMEGRGELLPEHRQNIYAKESGIVIKVLADHAQIVEEGQQLAEMRSIELEQELARLTEEFQKADIEKRYSIEQPGQNYGAEDAIANIRFDSLKQQLALVEERQETLEVQSPIPGMVATWDPKLVLGGRPLNRGDPVLEVWKVDGQDANWVLEVKMPEERIGHILDADRRRLEQDHPPLSASFILASHPDQRLRGHVVKINSTARLDEDTNEHVVMVRIVPDNVERVQAIMGPMQGALPLFSVGLEFRTQLDERSALERLRKEFQQNEITLSEDVALSTERDPWVITDNTHHRSFYVLREQEGLSIYEQVRVTEVVMKLADGTELRLRPGAEVRAKVECGKRAMGYVLLRELIEFVYETIIF